jgi:hypothetical protein
MAERSYPFDGGIGSTITEQQWSYLAVAWQDDGVHAEGPWGPELKVSTTGAVTTLHVAAGHATIRGHHYHADAPVNVTITANGAANPRIDIIVLRLDRAANSITIVHKPGVAAASPTAPAVDRGDVTPEVLLATFTIAAGANVVTVGNLSDTREFIGRRIRISESPTSFPRGSVIYRPSDDQFLVRRTSGAEPILTGLASQQRSWASVQTGGDAFLTSSSSWQAIPAWPAVTVTVPPTGVVMVAINALFQFGELAPLDQNFQGHVGFSVAGATPAYERAARWEQYQHPSSLTRSRYGVTSRVSGLTPGSAVSIEPRVRFYSGIAALETCHVVFGELNIWAA